MQSKVPKNKVGRPKGVKIEKKCYLRPIAAKPNPIGKLVTDDALLELNPLYIHSNDGINDQDCFQFDSLVNPVLPINNKQNQLSNNAKIKKNFKKRDKIFHNAEERLRKEKINNWINKLGELLYKSPGVRQSKNKILEEAYRYIDTKENKTSVLNDLQVDELLLRIKALEQVLTLLISLLKKHSVPVPENIIEPKYGLLLNHDADKIIDEKKVPPNKKKKVCSFLNLFQHAKKQKNKTKLIIKDSNAYKTTFDACNIKNKTDFSVNFDEIADNPSSLPVCNSTSETLTHTLPVIPAPVLISIGGVASKVNPLSILSYTSAKLVTPEVVHTHIPIAVAAVSHSHDASSNQNLIANPAVVPPSITFTCDSVIPTRNNEENMNSLEIIVTSEQNLSVTSPQSVGQNIQQMLPVSSSIIKFDESACSVDTTQKETDEHNLLPPPSSAIHISQKNKRNQSLPHFKILPIVNSNITDCRQGKSPVEQKFGIDSLIANSSISSCTSCKEATTMISTTPTTSIINNFINPKNEHAKEDSVSNFDNISVNDPASGPANKSVTVFSNNPVIVASISPANTLSPNVTNVVASKFLDSRLSHLLPVNNAQPVTKVNSGHSVAALLNNQIATLVSLKENRSSDKQLNAILLPEELQSATQAALNTDAKNVESSLDCEINKDKVTKKKPMARHRKPSAPNKRWGSVVQDVLKHDMMLTSFIIGRKPPKNLRLYKKRKEKKSLFENESTAIIHEKNESLTSSKNGYFFDISAAITKAATSNSLSFSVTKLTTLNAGSICANSITNKDNAELNKHETSLTTATEVTVPYSKKDEENSTRKVIEKQHAVKTHSQENNKRLHNVELSQTPNKTLHQQPSTFLQQKYPQSLPSEPIQSKQQNFQQKQRMIKKQTQVQHPCVSVHQQKNQQQVHNFSNQEEELQNKQQQQCEEQLLNKQRKEQNVKPQFEKLPQQEKKIKVKENKGICQPHNTHISELKYELEKKKSKSSVDVKKSFVPTMKERTIHNKWLEIEKNQTFEQDKNRLLSDKSQCTSPVISYPTSTNSTRKRSNSNSSSKKNTLVAVENGVKIDAKKMKSAKSFSAEALCKSANLSKVNSKEKVLVNQYKKHNNIKPKTKSHPLKQQHSNYKQQYHLPQQQQQQQQQQSTYLQHLSLYQNKLKHQPDISNTNPLPTILNIFAPAPLPTSTDPQPLNQSLSNFSAETLLNNTCDIGMLQPNIPGNNYTENIILNGNTQLFTNFSTDSLLNGNPLSYGIDNLIAQNNTGNCWNPQSWLSPEMSFNEQMFHGNLNSPQHQRQQQNQHQLSQQQQQHQSQQRQQNQQQNQNQPHQNQQQQQQNQQHQQIQQRNQQQQQNLHQQQVPHHQNHHQQIQQQANRSTPQIECSPIKSIMSIIEPQTVAGNFNNFTAITTPNAHVLDQRDQKMFSYQMNYRDTVNTLQQNNITNYPNQSLMPQQPIWNDFSKQLFLRQPGASNISNDPVSNMFNTPNTNKNESSIMFQNRKVNEKEKVGPSYGNFSLVSS